MSMSLRSAKVRFCVLAATLSLMMGHVWAGIFLARLHSFVSLSLLLRLLACWCTGRRCMSWVPVLDHSARLPDGNHALPHAFTHTSSFCVFFSRHPFYVLPW